MYRKTSGCKVGFVDTYQPFLGPYNMSTSHYTTRNQFPGQYNPSQYMTRSDGYTNHHSVRTSSGTTVPVIPVLDTSKNLVSQSTVGTGNTVGKLEENYSRAKTMGNFTSEDHVYTVGSSSLSRAHEKEELQRLNDKLSHYIIKVRQLGQQSRQIDSAAFLQSTKILEEEVTSLKSLYEKELNSLRLQLEAAVKEKNNLHQYCSKYQQNVKELEAKLLMETDTNKKLVDQINGFQQKITFLEQELVKARMVPLPNHDVPRMRRDIDNLTKENQILKQRLEQEQSLKKEIEENFIAFKKKVEFDQKVQLEQQSELRQRLEMSTSTIFELESKIKQLGKTDTNIPELLKQVREAAEVELRKYQSESEQQISKSMNALKVQMQNDSAIIDRLEQDKAQAFGIVGDLKATITGLEGQIKASASQQQSLEALLQEERSRFAAQLHSMENRFQQFQEMLFVKLKEVNMSKESYIPLKAEIEALKILLEEEEKRLNATFTTYQQTTSHTYGSSSNVAQTMPQQQISSYRTTSYGVMPGFRKEQSKFVTSSSHVTQRQ